MLSNAGLSKNFWPEALAYACYLVNRLPSSAIGGKTLLEVQSGKAAQDYDSLRIFGCPAYYHVKEDKLDSRAKKSVFIGFKKGVKDYKIWDPKDKKFVLNRDDTFDKASMMKPTISQQVEIEKTKGVSQQVESDVTSSSLERSVSLEITTTVTQGSGHVAEHDTDNDEDQGQAMGDVHESIVVGRTSRNSRMPTWLTTDMIVAYALPVVEEVISSTYRKLKSV